MCKNSENLFTNFYLRASFLTTYFYYYMKTSSIFYLFVLFTGITCYSFAQKKQVSLEEIWASPTFNAEYVSGFQSMNDGVSYSQIEADDKGYYIAKYSFSSQKKIGEIARLNDIKNPVDNTIIELEDYEFSADESKLLVSSNVQSIYRHSTQADYFIYDIKSKKTTALSEGGQQRLATFSPQGTSVAFVRDNNLYYKNLTNNQEVQITKDGKFNEVIYGATDWVYEEEFGFDKAFFWSPDGKSIAYYRFDESKVREFSMDMYGELYPTQYVYKYPKAGEDNAVVSIHVYNLEQNTSKPLSLGEYEYIPRIQWSKDPLFLYVQKLNRHQNDLSLLRVNIQSGEIKLAINEKSATYVDIHDNLTFLDDRKHFIWTSEKDGYNHIYLYGIEGNLIRQITKGEWDVTEYLGYNEKNKTLYYVSAESSPMERDLFSIDMEGKNKKKLSTRKGQNSAQFSKGMKYYLNYHSDANTPPYISLHEANGKEIKVLKNNAALIQKMNEYDIAKKEFFKLTTSENITLNAWMIKPVNFDANKRYPVLMFVYGGPGAQTVQDSWDSKNYLWYQFLAQKGYIIVSVDNRGTGARGEAFKKCTYKELGKLEVIDQIESAKFLKNLPFVDGNRIGIWGWSYGGFMSSNCIMQGADVFSTAIAVAPVTTWRYYDSIYTERYMQTPQENPDGYDKNSPMYHVNKLKGKYLLIHGMADDNVHFQHAVDLTKALIDANKQFDLMMYPNKNHGIYGGNTRIHLYQKMTDYILENL
jgi:dipeptidyl-peptidase 4